MDILHNTDTPELVEKCFPKGCKERGQAIVLHAEMLMWFNDLLASKDKRIKELEEEIKCWETDENLTAHLKLKEKDKEILKWKNIVLKMEAEHKEEIINLKDTAATIYQENLDLLAKAKPMNERIARYRKALNKIAKEAAIDGEKRIVMIWELARQALK